MNRTTWLLIASASLTAIGATPALGAEPGFYLSAGLGKAEDDPGKSIGLNISSGLPLNGIWHIDPDRVDADNHGAAWNVALGYAINRYIAGEVAYIDFGTADFSEHYDLSSLSTSVVVANLTYRYSSKTAGPALSVVGSLPLGKGFDVFVRAGALFADRELDISQSVEINGTKFGSTVFLGGAGVDWLFASRWAVRAEYQRTGALGTTFLTGETELERVSLSVLFRL